MGRRWAAADRFWAKVALKAVSMAWPAKAKDDCWIWLGAKSRGGVTTRYKRNVYGNFWEPGVYWKAHRYSWAVIFDKPLEADDVLDHVVCGYTLCVNPAHMEVVTRGVNTARANRKRRVA